MQKSTRPTLNDLTVDDYKYLKKLMQPGGWFELSPEECRKLSGVQKLFNGDMVNLDFTSPRRIRFQAKYELLNWLQGE
jgi:hypothetical protein